MNSTRNELVGKKGRISVDLLEPPAFTDSGPPSHITYGTRIVDASDPMGQKEIFDPFDVSVNTAGLSVAQNNLIQAAQTVLGKYSSGLPAYVFGGEGAQHGGKPLPKLLIDAGDAGFDVMQPSGNHIDLARCADDDGYATWVRAVHKAAGMPLLSVSVHMDAYLLMAATNDVRAMAILSPNPQLSNEHIQRALMQRMAKILLGASRLGVRVLHLFWGQPGQVPLYGWPFHEAGGANVKRMQVLFVSLVKPLVDLAQMLGIYLCHELHFGTIAMNADDYIIVWEQLGKPIHFALGFDPSHFWHGEPWYMALDKLRRAGVKIMVCHFKQAILLSGRPMLGYEDDDRYRGMMFCSIDAQNGLVDMNLYAGQLTLPNTGLTDFWHTTCNLPIPGYVEAEDPHFNTWDILVRGVEYLQRGIGKMHLAGAHFTAEMAKAQ